MSIGVVTVLERLAARHGVNAEPGSLRERQIAKWIEDLGPSIPDGAIGYLERELDRLDSWPKFGEFRESCRKARDRLKASAGIGGAVCGVCTGKGWAQYRRVVIPGGPSLPWAAVCLCSAGDKLPACYLRVDRDVFDELRAESSAPSQMSTSLRREAALAYIRVAFGRDDEPIYMVEAILAGKRDDVVRTLVGDSRVDATSGSSAQ